MQLRFKNRHHIKIQEWTIGSTPISWDEEASWFHHPKIRQDKFQTKTNRKR